MSGISLRLIVGLAATAHGSLRVDSERLDVSVDRTTPLRSALRDAHAAGAAAAAAGAGAGARLDPPARPHRRRRGPGGAGRRPPRSLVYVGELDSAGAAGIVVSGLAGKPRADARDCRRPTGLPVVDVPLDHIATFTTEVLSAILEHQTAILRRLEHADRALVQIVLAGGSLDDLCQQVVGFLDGAAMVTTTDGRVIARAGSARELEGAPTASSASTARAAAHGGRAEGPAARRTDGEPRGRRRIVAGNPTTGCSSPSAAIARLTIDDVRLLERAATVAALAITKDAGRLGGREQVPRRVPPRRAGRAAPGPPAEAVAHASSLGWDIDRPMVVVVAETDEDDRPSTRGRGGRACSRAVHPRLDPRRRRP